MRKHKKKIQLTTYDMSYSISSADLKTCIADLFGLKSISKFTDAYTYDDSKMIFDYGINKGMIF